ncbi:MAG TPA: HAD family phosphatase [Chlamydiales bacterium]|nr:HAD family phosphatase [Chlamydiales bacterium]
MDWIHKFQLFLFDFDGLLVNTEHLHYQAYINMLALRGCHINWSFSQFCSLAHMNAEALREQIYAEFPTLEPDWKILYAEKKAIYLELLKSGKVELMPGVSELLQELEKAKIERCVVTNSLLEQIQMIRSQQPLLKKIPHWITREDYDQPKPNPECYLRAIELFGKKGDRIIGFEDSLRGLAALQQTPALPILICSTQHPLLKEAKGAIHFQSFTDISLP